MPAWLTEDDLDVYAGEFERTGFTGGLNRYRNVDRDWEDLSAFRGRPIEVPALFVGGDRDGPTIWGMRSIERFGETLPRLHRSIILPGCGHWTQQERPAEVNEALLEFLGSAVTPATGRRWPTGWPSTTTGRRRLRRPRRAPARRPRVRRAADRPGAAGRPARRCPATARRTRCTLSFAVAGTGGEPIRYEVERTRDGSQLRHPARRRPPGSGASSLVLTADFHARRARRRVRDAGDPRACPVPTACPSGATTTRASSRATCRSLDGDRLPHTRRAWFRPTAPVPDDPLLHLQALAYLSDHGPTRAAREPHAGLADDARRMSVSLDHSVWFHRPVDVNQWLLSELRPRRHRPRPRPVARHDPHRRRHAAGDRRPGGPPAHPLNPAVRRP